MLALWWVLCCDLEVVCGPYDGEIELCYINQLLYFGRNMVAISWGPPEGSCKSDNQFHSMLSVAFVGYS